MIDTRVCVDTFLANTSRNGSGVCAATHRGRPQSTQDEAVRQPLSLNLVFHDLPLIVIASSSVGTSHNNGIVFGATSDRAGDNDEFWFQYPRARVS
jgi:hypothetical protein